MLFLSRKIGESVIINNSIEMTIIEVRGKTVKIGFNFPPDASVLRKEIYDKITEENRAASTTETNESELLEALENLDMLPEPPSTPRK